MADLSHLNQILVVEDEALILLDLEQTLTDAGVGTVLSAATVADALQVLDAVTPNAAIVDLHLGRDGWSYAVAHRLKEKGVPFVFSSGSSEVADGFRDVPLVIKPFSSEQVAQTLADVCLDRNIAAA